MNDKTFVVKCAWEGMMLVKAAVAARAGGNGGRHRCAQAKDLGEKSRLVR
jgi:hypothetical protein